MLWMIYSKREEGMRKSQIERNTGETDVRVELDLDGSGKCNADTGVGFLDHMMELFARHGNFDISITCKGDTQVDDHHSVEDIGIALGMAFDEALGDKAGISRYGHMILPMDEALILTAVDLSGRSNLSFEADLPADKVGTFDTELVEEFMIAFVRNCPSSIHIRQLAGRNTHHIIEGMFKSLARSLRQAVSIDEASKGRIPSTKGVL